MERALVVRGGGLGGCKPWLARLLAKLVPSWTCTHRDWYEVTSSGDPGSVLVGLVRTAAAKGMGWRWGQSKCSKGRVGEMRPLHARMPPRSTQGAPPHPAR